MDGCPKIYWGAKPHPSTVVSANSCHSPLHSIHKHLKSRSSVKSLGISDHVSDYPQALCGLVRLLVTMILLNID